MQRKLLIVWSRNLARCLRHSSISVINCKIKGKRLSVRSKIVLLLPHTLTGLHAAEQHSIPAANKHILLLNNGQTHPETANKRAGTQLAWQQRPVPAAILTGSGDAVHNGVPVPATPYEALSASESWRCRYSSRCNMQL